MRLVESSAQIISNIISFNGEKILDIGCGTGELVRWMSLQGASVVGLDTEIMIQKAKALPKTSNEEYLAISNDLLPFPNEHADSIIYFASLHHVPENKILMSLKESSRVLKKSGLLIIVEPVLENGSYYEITKLVEDEREIQALAYEAIKKCKEFDLSEIAEEMFYFERSFEDYVALITTHVDDDEKRNECISHARIITKRMAIQSERKFCDFRYKSICRLNIMQKSN